MPYVRDHRRETEIKKKFNSPKKFSHTLVIAYGIKIIILRAYVIANVRLK